MKTIKNDYTHDELIEKLTQNPFVSSIYNHTHFCEEISKFSESIEKLKEDKNYSKYKILSAMLDYARIYEQFRPIRITKGDIYYGTVDKMDGLYYYLFDYLNVDLLIEFSRLPKKYPKKTSKNKHSDVNWNKIIADIKVIDKAILGKMERAEKDLNRILGRYSPFYITR